MFFSNEQVVYSALIAKKTAKHSTLYPTFIKLMGVAYSYHKSAMSCHSFSMSNTFNIATVKQVKNRLDNTLNTCRMTEQ